MLFRPHVVINNMLSRPEVACRNKNEEYQKYSIERPARTKRTINSKETIIQLRLAAGQRSYCFKNRKLVKKKKTYNSGNSLVVTDPTTNPPLTGLITGEQTGSDAFQWVWSYVTVKGGSGHHIGAAGMDHLRGLLRATSAIFPL